MDYVRLRQVHVGRIGALIIAGVVSSAPMMSSAATSATQIFDGQCEPSSHISEGPRTSDLTKRRSTYFCDSFILSAFPTKGTVFFQFSDRKSHHEQPIGFAGALESMSLLKVERVYLEPGKALIPNSGYCRVFFKDPKRYRVITAVVCGAQIDEGEERTVPVINFKVRT